MARKPNQKRRAQIPRETAHAVLLASEFCCCICRGRRVVLHHINEDPSDNRPENLAVLCHFHHDEAHTNHALSRNLTGHAIASAKKKWEADVRAARLDRVSLSVDAPLNFRYWTYHNTNLLFDMCEHAGVPTNRGVGVLQLRNQDVVDDSGRPAVEVPSAHNGMVQTMYSSLPMMTAKRLNHHLAELTDRLIQAISPVQVDLSWPRSVVNKMLTPGSVVFICRDLRFRVVHRYPDYEQREARTSANNTAVAFQFDTRTVFSNSSLTLHFTGHGIVAALLRVSSRAKDPEKSTRWLVRATPVALGVGFPSLSGPKPEIAYRKAQEADESDLDDDY